jgi:hypothetical protein
MTLSRLFHVIARRSQWYWAGSTLAANPRGIKRFLTPTKKTCLAAWCAPLAARRVFCRVLPQAYQTGLMLRGDRRVLTQGVAQKPRVCTQHTARLGVKNRLMPRELAAVVLPALVHHDSCWRDITDGFGQFTSANNRHVVCRCHRSTTDDVKLVCWTRGP